MSEILAVLEGDKEHGAVLGLADAVAALLSVKVRLLRVPPTEALASQVVAALAEESAAGAVVRGEVDPDAVFWDIIQQSTKPVVVTPFAAADLSRRIGRVLLPLDGSPETARAVAPLAELLLASGTDVIATHVFDESTVPAFWDQAAHAREPWTGEFLQRNLPAGDRLHLRHGRPSEEIIAASETTGSDLILLGWSQRISGDRARVVRLALEGKVPLMLVGLE
jgi:hypothetical protein